ncbi:signal peptidase I [Actinokineospora alba]|uniref:Signal peptidase I n=1 Tax=Actinokineospora alba TaxID=504798 RepID=A0A1H0M0B5_9PSEU|nr:signal peptidase I [Actinokineospora alba]TDP67537.1 signal peptidase I [Actinokineospora alba]SDO73912.1 signal peptidase I [Actinokineospora alba]
MLGAVAALAALALVGVVIAVTFANRIDGQSMSPTLGDGDRILLEPFFDPADLRRFDIVAARPSPGSPAVVKRVIGLPGDAVKIEVRADGGASVMVRPAGAAGWSVVDAPVWTENWHDARQCCAADGKSGNGEAVVPAGHVFVLGDNPSQSDDSRKYGWIPISEVIGRMAWRLYPLDRLGSLDPGADMRLVREP